MERQNHSERWDEFQKYKRDSIYSHKEDILIIIYGAYNPPTNDEHLGEKDRLIKLRDCLRGDGFLKTCIVDDFPNLDNSPAPNLYKSLSCLEKADLNLLVFTCRGNTDSLVFELKHAIDHEILSKCRIFEEEYKNISAMGTLPKEKLGLLRWDVAKIKRDDDEDLYEHVSSAVFQFLRQKFRI